MCDDAASFLPGAFRRICVPPIQPIDPPTTNLQDYVRRARLITSRPAQRPEGTPVALAVVWVDADSVTVAARARGAPRSIDLAFSQVGSSSSSSNSNNTPPLVLSLLPSPTTPGLMLGALPANALQPNTQYQFTVSAVFQYSIDTPRVYSPRDERGYPIVHQIWTHGAPTVSAIIGRMVQVQPPAFNARRPAWFERREGGGGGGASLVDLGRGPQSESVQVFVVFSSSAENSESAVVGPLTATGVAFAPSSLPAGVEYDASYAAAVYSFNGEAEEVEYATDYFSVIF